MKKLLAFMLILTLAFVVAGCNNDDDDDDKGPILPVSVDVTGAREVGVGDSIKLTANVTPDNATNKEVTWTSAQSDIAAVDADGNVTGVRTGSTIIRATAKANTNAEGQLRVTVTTTGTGGGLPDLGGYHITIAQAGHAVHELDPFNADYSALDREAKQQAWTWVEQNYNVEISVEAYPPDAEWGPPRWNYVLNQAASNVADYDFYTVPDNMIGLFVEGNAIIDVTDWYALYGQDSMDSVYRGAGTYKGRLYSITGGQSGIYNVIYYNTNLLNRIGMDKTPGELFNDDEWTFSAFVDYAIEAQTKLDALGDQDYVSVAGMPTYYWLGMANAGGVNIANTSALQLDALNPMASDAAAALREIYSAGAMDTLFQVDAGVTSWMEGRALFNSGDLWFVNTSNRWPDNLWGEGEATQYDYVPFPRPDSMASREDQRIGLAGTATFVMPVGRVYPEGVTARDIYRALMDTFLKTREFRLADPNYDEEVARRQQAERFNSSECSIQAFMFMAERTSTYGFFEPFAISANPITHTGGGSLSVAVRSYITSAVDSYAEAVTPVLPEIQEALTRAFS